MQLQNKQNNFGFLRLLFAVLVIFSHAPEGLDGSRKNELMINFFGTMSMGDLAVDCFFMISGFLILMSYQNSSSFKSYIKKRVLRIYPGFIVAFLFCVLCVVPLAKSTEMLLSFDSWFWFKSTVKMMLLDAPWIADVFNTPIHFINLPMWTIRYEFLCYLTLPIINYFFKYKLQAYIFLFLMLICLGLLHSLFDISVISPKPFDFESGSLLRLFSSYIAGNIFYLAKDKINFNKTYTLICLVMLILILFDKQFARIGLITFGAYLLFNFALNYKNKYLSKVGTKTDLSYGIYLYAWPVQNLIIQNHPVINPYVLSFCILVITVIIAYISWRFVEKPFIDMKYKTFGFSTLFAKNKP